MTRFALMPLLLFLMGALCLNALVLPRSPYDSVNPLIGTDADGNTFPAATLPFGMMQWGPDTRADGWYHYADNSIRGFSLTHISGAGCPIYADVPILPWTGELPSGTPRDAKSSFSHSHERVHPGYYRVDLYEGIRTELTTATHSGIGRFDFPASGARTFLFKAGESATISEGRKDSSSVEIRGDDAVVGTVHSGGFCKSESNYVLYFVAKFSSPFSKMGTWDDSLHAGAKSAAGYRAGAYVSFPAGAEPILLKVGISFVSVENAAANLDAEIPGWDFDKVRESARKRWSEVFAKVQVDSGTAEQRTIFYTGLYHMLLAPNIFSDVNGDYIGFDGKIRRLAKGEAQYANFSDWDTYRSLTQFHSLLFPDETSQMMQSLVRDAEQSGWLPRWPVANDVSYVMGGDSPAILLAEAYSFNAGGFDTKTALRFMLKGAREQGTGPHGRSQRPGLAEYLKNGYVPAELNESGASVTLEYASADFAIFTHGGSSRGSRQRGQTAALGPELAHAL